MGHKADSSFFKEKRPWSERKDRILGSYLTAYLPKISTQQRPVVIVDAFAGPGMFDDGKPGSPYIIAQTIQTALSRSPPVPMSLQCIELDQQLCTKLKGLMQSNSFATVTNQSFLDGIPRIEELAAKCSVFLYVDPYAIEGLEWEAMDRVFRKIAETRSSIEVLLNFNAWAFVRRALASLGIQMRTDDVPQAELDEGDSISENPVSVDRLNTAVGGDWWQAICRRGQSAAGLVRDLTEALRQRLSNRFHETCYHPMKALPHHKVPKYFLVYGSRHPDGLCLMNDEMVKSLETLAVAAAPKDPTLFEMRSQELVPDTGRLADLILKHASAPLARHQVIVRVIREAFCEFSYKQIRKAVEDLLREGKRLKSETGKIRINDQTKISAIR